MIGGARLRTALLALAVCGGCRSQPPQTSEPLLRNTNIVLIVVDTLRADHLSGFGHPHPTSPYLDRLADQSVTFTRALATASHTVPSMLSLWTGRYPVVHGNQYFADVRAFRVPTPNTRPSVPAPLPMLAEHLRDNGYRTAAVTTNPWLREEYGFARGFDVYHHLDEVPAPRGPAVNAVAREIVEEWRARRFFLYVHYMDVHLPFDPEPRYRGRFPARDGLPELMTQWHADYQAEIRAVDDYIRGVVEALSELGLAEDTLLIVTSDHGEEYRDHGRFGHGHALYQELIHVPLLLHHRKLAAGRIDVPVSLVDLFPTVAALVTGPLQREVDGISLVPLILDRDRADRDRVLFGELGNQVTAIRDNQKLIRDSTRPKERETAFDLRDAAGERESVDASTPWVAELAAEIDRHAARASAADQAPYEVLDPAVEERVRALGY